jgi:Zn-dependent protease
MEQPPSAPQQPQPVSHPGAKRVVRLFGIDVWVHWAWLLVAVLELSFRKNAYSSQLWNVLEYLGLFACVLLHEFGHALACRSVGGRAEHILLWPLGGVAYVEPPRRPGAVLWSIAAGPLVNVVLFALLLGLRWWLGARGVELSADMERLTSNLMWINAGLLIFNLLPVYPLDGGQIFQSLLWFFVGEVRSLKYASFVGLLGAAMLLALGLARQALWTTVIAAYMGLRAWGTFQYARQLTERQDALRAAPLRQQAHCPHCSASPPLGPFWRCSCGQPFDPFATAARCPHCGETFTDTTCLTCTQAHPLEEWLQPRALPGRPG